MGLFAHVVPWSLMMTIVLRAEATTPAPTPQAPTPAPTPQAIREWQIISNQFACETNNDGITRTYGAYGYTLTTCKTKCIETPVCAAIDFYTDSGWCNLFDTPCTSPMKREGGPISYKWIQATCPSGFDFHYEGHDGPNGVHESGGDTDMDVCANICRGDASCVAISYQIAAFVTFSRCYSYTTLGTPSPNPSEVVCIKQAPTPAPTPQAPTPAPTPQAGSMSGDPIVSVNGWKVKFELPSGQTTLMWAADDLEIFSKADVMTPDKLNQWFSDFSLVVNGHHAAHIQRKEIKVTSKEMLGTLNTISLSTMDEAGHSHAVSSPGSYPVGNGSVTIIVKRDGAMVGPLKRDVVSVNSNSISCSISAERAKKFSPNEEKVLKYSHLDIILHKMSRNVKGGLFAEIWGFVPMSSKTARMIKQVKAE